MKKTATSLTVWNDSVGKRMSITFSEIDESTGKIISDNKRDDAVIVDKAALTKVDELLEFAQSILDSRED